MAEGSPKLCPQGGVQSFPTKVMNWPTQDRWNSLLESVGARRSGLEWYDRLAKAYGEPQRHYHNHRHIAECLAEFDQARGLAGDAVTVELALWFHDAVYDPKA